MSNTNATWRIHSLVLAGYLLLALALTWPTAAQLTTHVPGDGIDDPAIVWNLWWVKYSLLNAPQNPLTTQFMFYPLGINLAFYTLTTLNGLTVIPLLLNLGVVTASNLRMLFSFTLGGIALFCLLMPYFAPPVQPNSKPIGEHPPIGGPASLGWPLPLAQASSFTWHWGNSTSPAPTGFPSPFSASFICTASLSDGNGLA